MVEPLNVRDAVRLTRDGWCDEDVERLTGLPLLSILAIRAAAASEPLRYRGLDAGGVLHQEGAIT